MELHFPEAIMKVQNLAVLPTVIPHQVRSLGMCFDEENAVGAAMEVPAVLTVLEAQH